MATTMSRPLTDATAMRKLSSVPPRSDRIHAPDRTRAVHLPDRGPMHPAVVPAGIAALRAEAPRGPGGGGLLPTPPWFHPRRESRPPSIA